ncbi:MAG TPA: CotH kinase family protein [Draconibacterium sp.]|nr:CotH kinase family protein [Draconibacterium sp.]
MNFFYRLLFVVIAVFVIFLNSNAQVLKINEIMSSNTQVVYDEDGDTPDWLEILNNSDSDINLSDYFLSENPDDLLKWQMPEIILKPNQPLLIYASGKDRPVAPLHWYTIIDIGQNWRYFVPSTEPSSAWKSYGFSETGWLTGPSGIGFGDGDDNTVIESGKMSVFMRKKFAVTDLQNLKSFWLHMDYDDGFVAYLNGTEICRASMGESGSAVSYNTAANSHEANIFNGGLPDGFDISQYINLLNENENVLAIQVHNTNLTSSDLSAIPILSVGYAAQENLNAPVSNYVNVQNLNPHTNFKLSASGETLCITFKDGTVSDSISYGIIPGNYSFGRDINNPENWGYFAESTPGFPNNTEIAKDFVSGEVKFSIKNMFLSTPQYLSLSGAAAGEEIRFTENGDEPKITSAKYQFGIQIDKNKVIRARIFKPGAIPGKITSHTYLFDEKPTLPVISISTNYENLWDNETGIYVLGDSYENQNPYFGANFWEDWEKPASIEMIGADGERVFNLNCGIKIFGAWSRANPQKSLAVFFSNEYGDPVLEDVALFKSKPEITSFKSFVLRNSGNDYSYTRFRDGFMTDLVRDMNTDIQAFEPAVLYLNGEYWGELNLREKVNEDYIESNHGVDSDKINILEGQSQIVEGSNSEYLELLDFLNSNSMVNNANYEYVASQIDIDNFIDYQLSQIYFNNRDWPGNNIKFWRPQAEDGKWRWILYDTDFGFGIYGNTDYTLNTIQFALEPNGPSWPNPPWSTFMLRRLVQNSTFKYKFITRFADMLNTTFVSENVVAKIDSIGALVLPEIPDNYKRWGTPGPSTWNSAVETMKNFAQNRPQYVRNHINQQFINAGIFDLMLSVVPAEAGNVKLNTIEVGGDLWQGKYFQNVPVTLTANPRNGYIFKRWEVNGVTVLDNSTEIYLKKATTVKAIYEEVANDGNSVVINEINYSSSEDYDAGDWVEIYNWGRVDLNISGWIFKDNDDDHQYIIPQNTVLKSNDYLVFCRKETDFNTIYPNVLNHIGDFDFGLGSTEDALRLYDTAGQLVDSVAYGSEFPWPAEPNGNGLTLELSSYHNDNSNAESWKASVVNLGTPGAVNSITTGTDWLAKNSTEKQLKIYPNPFTEETRLKIENDNNELISVNIFSLDGRLVKSDITQTGEYIWHGDNQNGQKLQPGIYICKLQSGIFSFTGKVVLSK